MLLLLLLWILISLIVVSLVVLLSKKYGLEFLLVSIASLVIISNILAVKVVSFGIFTASAGVIVYSMTFMILNVIAELYDKKTAKRLEGKSAVMT